MRNIDLREAYEAVYESSDEMAIVIQFLLDEGFVETKEDGSLMVESMSQAWYNTICEELIDEGVEKGGQIADWRAPQKNDGIGAKAGAPKVAKKAEPNDVLSRAGKPKADKGDDEKMKKILGPARYAEYLKKK